MKRKELLAYLTENGCQLLRECGRHLSWWNPVEKEQAKKIIVDIKFI
jgi:hypothetical protein